MATFNNSHLWLGLIDPSTLAEALQILGPVSVHQASSDLRATLVQLRLKGARNIIIDTGFANVESVIQATLDTGMMTKSYSYIFTMLVSFHRITIITSFFPFEQTLTTNCSNLIDCFTESTWQILWKSNTHYSMTLCKATWNFFNSITPRYLLGLIVNCILVLGVNWMTTK